MNTSDGNGAVVAPGVGTASAAGASNAPESTARRADLSERPGAHITQLTGVRIVAAMWVVLFHLRGNIWFEYPGLEPWLGPVIKHGDLGVDLFFALSGFVLTLNYVDRMGDRLDRGDIGRFIWARLARVWPVYFVTLTIAALWHGALMATRQVDPVAVRDFSVPSYLRQLFLVVQWTEADSDRLTWNGPAWSVSAEMLVYLLFPLIALLLLRFDWALRSRHMLVIATLAVVPSVLFVIVTGTLYSPYFWLLRLVGSFFAGCLACLVARRLGRTRRNNVIGTVGTFLVVALGTAVMYVAENTGKPQVSGLLALLFAPLLILLVMSRSGLSRLFSTRAFVLGGHISYSVYLVHMLMIEPLWFAHGRWPGLFAPHSTLARVLLFAMPVLVCLAAYVLWRYVEEPARKKMRAMTKRPGRPAVHRTPDPIDIASAPPADHMPPAVDTPAATPAANTQPAGRAPVVADERGVSVAGPA